MLRTALLIILSLSAVRAEIREFNGVIEADSSFVHYSEGFIIAPGFIDLSGLTFTTMTAGEAGDYDPEMRDPSDESAGNSEDDDKTNPGDADANPNKDGGGHRLAVASYVSNSIVESRRRYAVLRAH